jgi:hypothetical protein
VLWVLGFGVCLCVGVAGWVGRELCLVTMADGPLPQQQASTDQQQIASASILLQIVMLGLSFVLGHVLRRHKIYYINEASASLLLGLFVGAIANISNTETHFRQWFNFHEEFFFLFLLPPIILYPHKVKKDFLLLFVHVLIFVTSICK